MSSKDELKDVEYTYHDSDDDNDDLDNTTANNQWKVNKQFIESMFTTEPLTKHLVFYGQNLILFYNTKIAAVKKLLESKGSDNKKNFIGDATIQNDQFSSINNIQNDSLLRNIESDRLEDTFEKYYEHIGSETSEVMKKDYEERHKTIMYNLLIKEYQEIIRKINEAIAGDVSKESNEEELAFDKLFEKNFAGGCGYNTNTKLIQTGGEPNYNVTEQFDSVIETFNYIQNDVITNPLVLSKLLEIMFKIQNSELDHSVIREGYFDISGLNQILNDLNPNYLKGGAPFSQSGGRAVEVQLKTREKDQIFNVTVKKGDTIHVNAYSNMSALMIWKTTHSTNNVKLLEHHTGTHNFSGMVGAGESNEYIFTSNGPDVLKWVYTDNRNEVLATATINVIIDETPDSPKPVIPASLQTKLDDGVGVYIDSSTNDIYKGTFIDKMFHGQGIMIYNDNSFYVGKWKENQRNGTGWFNDDKNTYYVGNWDGTENGIGMKVIWNDTNPEIYIGNMLNGLYNGDGVLYTNGSFGQGEWNKGHLSSLDEDGSSGSHDKFRTDLPPNFKMIDDQIDQIMSNRKIESGTSTNRAEFPRDVIGQYTYDDWKRMDGKGLRQKFNGGAPPLDDTSIQKIRADIIPKTESFFRSNPNKVQRLQHMDAALNEANLRYTPLNLPERVLLDEIHDISQKRMDTSIGNWLPSDSASSSEPNAQINTEECDKLKAKLKEELEEQNMLETELQEIISAQYAYNLDRAAGRVKINSVKPFAPTTGHGAHDPTNPLTPRPANPSAPSTPPPGYPNVPSYHTGPGHAGGNPGNIGTPQQMKKRREAREAAAMNPSASQPPTINPSAPQPPTISPSASQPPTINPSDDPQMKMFNEQIKEVQLSLKETNSRIEQLTQDIRSKCDNSSIVEMRKNLDNAKKRSAENERKFNETAQKLKDDISKLEKGISDIDASIKTTEEKQKEINKVYDELIEGIKQKMTNMLSYFDDQTKTMETLMIQLTENIRQVDKNMNDNVKKINDFKKDISQRSNANELAEHEISKCEERVSNTVLKIDVDEFRTGTSLTPKERFIHKYINSNYLKKNLYEFINQCKKLDSVPEWRATISQLIVSYLSSYLPDPNSINSTNPKYITVIPSYETFNLVLMGTPGVGKSYTADIIGKALKLSGLLTIGNRHDIKKPDIVGSYTGQTAPKVYKELTQCLGKVIFVDEAYSIAGAKDQVKGTFNEFGQEALDAITDYTSEHIGLSAFVMAGYEYEMRNQFLNVNIGLPRRFPTLLTLRRYNVSSFWNIIRGYIVKFNKKLHVDNHHKACFELLNLIFNFQCEPNPIIKLSKNWDKLWKSNPLKNIFVNLKISTSNTGDKKIVKTPFLQILDFNKKIQDIANNPITSETVEELISKKYLKSNTKTETKTFIKAFVIFKFCDILNGDVFRSQADNLTKFSQYMLENKIINPDKKFNPTSDNSTFGDTDWIEYIYFKLYFTKNPNKKINNIEFLYDDYKKEQLSTAGGFYKLIKKSKNNRTKSYKKSKNNRTIQTNVPIIKLIGTIRNRIMGGSPPTEKSEDVKRFVPDVDMLINDEDEENEEDDEKEEVDLSLNQEVVNHIDADNLYETGLEHYEKHEYPEAFEKFTEAIKKYQNHTNAMVKLAEMYANGDGVDVNTDKSDGFYIRAAENGNEHAKFILGKNANDEINKLENANIKLTNDIDVAKSRLDAAQTALDIAQQNSTKSDSEFRNLSEEIVQHRLLAEKQLDKYSKLTRHHARSIELKKQLSDNITQCDAFSASVTKIANEIQEHEASLKEAEQRLLLIQTENTRLKKKVLEHMSANDIGNEIIKLPSCRKYPISDLEVSLLTGQMVENVHIGELRREVRGLPGLSENATCVNEILTLFERLRRENQPNIQNFKETNRNMEPLIKLIDNIKKNLAEKQKNITPIIGQKNQCDSELQEIQKDLQKKESLLQKIERESGKQVSELLIIMRQNISQQDDESNKMDQNLEQLQIILEEANRELQEKEQFTQSTQESYTLLYSSNTAQIAINDTQLNERNPQRIKWLSQFVSVKKMKYEKELALANFILGKIYMTGPKDLDKAIQFFKDSAKFNHAEANKILGDIYMTDVDNKDIDESIQFYTKAAELGNLEAQVLLGRLYFEGEQSIDIAKDFSKSTKFYKLASQHTNQEAEFALATAKKVMESLESLVEATSVSVAEALYAYNKAPRIMKETHKSEHQTKVALLSTIQDKAKKAAEEVSDAEEKAKNAAGVILKSNEKNKLLYLEAKGFYEQQCFNETLLKKNDTEQLNLGLKFYLGQGEFTNDIPKAKELFEKSAEQGNVEAKYQLGEMYYLGEVVQQNLETAADYLKFAANKGHRNAQFYYGYLLFQRNDKTAKEYFLKAAQQGHPEAQYNYGVMLALEKDFDQAAHFFRLAAAQNVSEATKHLTKMKELELGMKNLVFEIKFDLAIITIKELIENITNIINSDSQSVKSGGAQVSGESKANPVSDTKEPQAPVNSSPTDKKRETNELFKKFQVDYTKYMQQYYENVDFSKDAKFLEFINVYILLTCYVEAYEQSKTPYGPFDTSSWWFFDSNTLNTILADFDITEIMKKYDSEELNQPILESIQKQSPDTPGEDFVKSLQRTQLELFKEKKLLEEEKKLMTDPWQLVKGTGCAGENIVLPGNKYDPNCRIAKILTHPDKNLNCKELAARKFNEIEAICNPPLPKPVLLLENGDVVSDSESLASSLVDDMVSDAQRQSERNVFMSSLVNDMVSNAQNQSEMKLPEPSKKRRRP
jgi:TPR repeat protein